MWREWKKKNSTGYTKESFNGLDTVKKTEDDTGKKDDYNI